MSLEEQAGTSWKGLLGNKEKKPSFFLILTRVVLLHT